MASIRKLLQQADYEYFDTVAREYWHTREPVVLDWVRYPDWLWPRLQDALGDVVQAGFDAQKRRIIDRIYSRPVSIYAPAPPPTPPPPSAAEALPVPDAARPAIIIRERQTVYPRTAIDTYTANRIPPLRHEITERRRLLCRDIVRDGIGRGDGVRPIMQDLRDNGFGMSDWHRETIARTEAATLFAHGQMAEMMESPSVVGFRFFAIIDDRTTETCAYLDGKEFLKGAADGVYPPLHYNCRSTIEEVFLWDKQPQWQTPDEVLAGAAKAQRPLPGFGHVDYDSLPREATAEDLYRTLNQSERAQAIRFADELAARAKALRVPTQVPTIRQVPPSPPKFATASEAEGWLRDTYPGYVWDMQSVNASMVDDVASAIAETLQDYPAFAKQLNGVETSRELASRTYAESYRAQDGTTIILNGKSFGSPRDRLVARMEKDIDARWHPATENPIKFTVTHECGHILDDGLRLHDAAKHAQIAQWREAWGLKGAYSVSDYAVENTREFFAEAFAMVRCSSRSTWPDAVRALAEILDGWK